MKLPFTQRGALAALAAIALAAMLAFLFSRTQLGDYRGKAQGAGERASELVSRVERIRSAMRASDIESPEDTARELEPAIATLVPAAASTGAQLGAPARQAEAAVRDYVAARAAESDTWR